MNRRVVWSLVCSSLIPLLLAACSHQTVKLEPKAPPADDAVSPLPSTIRELPIPNAHIVTRGKGTVVRGMNPKGHIQDLVNYGVTDVLIFKVEKTNEVQVETAELKQAGFPAERIRYVPFRWNGVSGFQEACETSIDGLAYLLEVYRTPGRKVFFHCAVGEDRSGILAGLFRLVTEKESLKKVFEEELCARGYEAGNAEKPADVVALIRKELTPVFLKMAYLIQSGAITAQKLDKSICQKEEWITRRAAKKAMYESSQYVCTTP